MNKSAFETNTLFIKQKSISINLLVYKLTFLTNFN